MFSGDLSFNNTTTIMEELPVILCTLGFICVQAAVTMIQLKNDAFPRKRKTLLSAPLWRYAFIYIKKEYRD